MHGHHACCCAEKDTCCTKYLYDCYSIDGVDSVMSASGTAVRHNGCDVPRTLVFASGAGTQLPRAFPNCSGTMTVQREGDGSGWQFGNPCVAQTRTGRLTASIIWGLISGVKTITVEFRLDPVGDFTYRFRWDLPSTLVQDQYFYLGGLSVPNAAWVASRTLSYSLTGCRFLFSLAASGSAVFSGVTHDWDIDIDIDIGPLGECDTEFAMADGVEELAGAFGGGRMA